MKAVVWTDAFQCMSIILGFVSIIAVGASEFGFGEIMNIADKGHRLIWNDFRPNPTIEHVVLVDIFSVPVLSNAR